MKRGREEYIACNECGWTGRESDASPGDMTDNWYYVDCPRCHNESISELELPTHTTNDHTITDADIQAECNNQPISQSQLPDINDPNIILTWNIIIIDNDEFDTYVIVKHNDRLVWKQQISYECYIDFIQFCIVAKLKYGNRLIEVKSSTQNQIYLYGNCIQSVGYITSVENAFKKIKNNIN
jgi:hypothetical protein